MHWPSARPTVTADPRAHAARSAAVRVGALAVPILALLLSMFESAFVTAADQMAAAAGRYLAQTAGDADPGCDRPAGCEDRADRG